jgi:hypothetical protein
MSAPLVLVRVFKPNLLGNRYRMLHQQVKSVRFFNVLAHIPRRRLIHHSLIPGERVQGRVHKPQFPLVRMSRR